MPQLSQLQGPPSPIETLQDPLLSERGLRLMVKRDDQRFIPAYPGDQAFGGNKWRKLHYNLLEARMQGNHRLLTFGGAYSNHIAATASAGSIFGFETIGVIRGEADTDNPTLRHARRCGMHLHFIDRTTYRRKMEAEVLGKLQDHFGPVYVIPEGGTNALALKGCREIVGELEAQLDKTFPDYLCLPAGTGGTLAGVIAGLEGRSLALGISVLKGDFLGKEVSTLLHENAIFYQNWSMVNGYHFGGYASFKPPLLDFIRNFRERHAIQLDPIYTAKLFYGIYDMISNGFITGGSTVLAIHTGGLQGIPGFEARHGVSL